MEQENFNGLWQTFVALDENIDPSPLRVPPMDPRRGAYSASSGVVGDCASWNLEEGKRFSGDKPPGGPFAPSETRASADFGGCVGGGLGEAGEAAASPGRKESTNDEGTANINPAPPTAVSKQTMQALRELGCDLETAAWRVRAPWLTDSECPSECGKRRSASKAADALFDALLRTATQAGVVDSVCARLEAALLEAQRRDSASPSAAFSFSERQLSSTDASSRDADSECQDGLPVSLEGLFAAPEELPPAPLLLSLLRSLLPTSQWHTSLRHFLSLTGSQEERRPQAKSRLKVEAGADLPESAPSPVRRSSGGFCRADASPQKPLRCSLFDPPQSKAKNAPPPAPRLPAAALEVRTPSARHAAEFLQQTNATEAVRLRRDFLLPRTPNPRQTPFDPESSSAANAFFWKAALQGPAEELQASESSLPSQRRICVLTLARPHSPSLARPPQRAFSELPHGPSSASGGLHDAQVLWDLGQGGSSLEALAADWLAEGEGTQGKAAAHDPESARAGCSGAEADQALFVENSSSEYLFRSLMTSLRRQLFDAQRREADFTLLVQLRRRGEKLDRKEREMLLQETPPVEKAVDRYFFTKVLEVDVLEGNSALRLRDRFLWSLDAGDAAVHSHVQQTGDELSLPRPLVVLYHLAMQRQIEAGRVNLVNLHREELLAVQLASGLAPPSFLRRKGDSSRVSSQKRANKDSPASVNSDSPEASSSSWNSNDALSVEGVIGLQRDELGGAQRSGVWPAVRSSWFEQSGCMQKKIVYALRLESFCPTSHDVKKGLHLPLCNGFRLRCSQERRGLLTEKAVARVREGLHSRASSQSPSEASTELEH